MNPGAEEICDNGLDDDCSGDALACRLEGTWPAEDAPIRLWAEPDGDGDQLGLAAVELDMNSDGALDLVVSAPYRYVDSVNDASVYYFEGPLTTASRSADTADIQWKTTTARVDDNLGLDLANAGDVNGDGYPELLIGSDDATWNDGENKGYRGMVDLVFGGPSPNTEVDLTWYCPERSQRCGSSVAGLGDLDGDGFADLAIGAHGYPSSQDQNGAVFLFYGGISALVGGEVTSAPASILGRFEDDNLGDLGSIAHADLDGDGFQDLLLGASCEDSGRPGQLYLLLGDGTRRSGEVEIELDNDARWEGTEVDFEFGHSVVAGFDVDGDG